MSKYDLSTISIDQKTIDEIMSAIDLIESKLPFLLSLSASEKKYLLKFGDKSVAFVDKAIEFANQNPEYLQKNFSINEAIKNIDTYNKLYNIIQKIAPLI